MNRKLYFLAAVMVPILGFSLFFVARRNLNGPTAEGPLVSAPEWATRPADIDPEPVPPPIVAALEDYRHLEMRLPPPLLEMLKQSRPEAVASGILVAPQRKQILWGHRDQEAVAIASLTKMMSILVALETIDQRPDLSLDTIVTVSRDAEAVGGRQVWLMSGHRYPLQNLLQASLIFSANDATHALTESVVPDNSMKTFLILMNRRARELGMVKARFYNVHGLPERGRFGENRASSRDLVVLAQAFQKHPVARELAATLTADFEHNNGKVVTLLNTNRGLLRNSPGVNGLKTGFTRDAGYCVVATCERDGEVLIAVATGFRSGQNRNLFVGRLFDWGYEQLGSDPLVAPLE